MAQSSACVIETGAARQVLRCQDGLIIEVEKGADYTFLDQDRDGRPDAVELRSRALLLHAPARTGTQRFQVLTPQAVAAVRGTDWAVDVDPGKTAVFVIDGQVSVRRANRRAAVALGPGNGVDVEAGTAPLVVKRWPAPRVAALLARFGR